MMEIAKESIPASKTARRMGTPISPKVVVNTAKRPSR